MMTWLVKKSLINFKKSQKLHHRLFQGHLQMKQKILDLIGKYVKKDIQAKENTSYLT